jgi:hypothetical protein
MREPDDTDDREDIGDIFEQGGDEEFKSSADLFGEELWTEVREVCDEAHRLLGAEAAGGYGAAETERVCLDIPKGLLLAASYVVARENFRQGRAWMEEALADKGAEGNAVRKTVHEFLTKCLKDALQEELHELATGGHRMLRAEAERRGWRKEKRGDQAR